MGAISATDIISIIQSEIENFNWDEASRETGNVIWVGDGIATVYGIDHAMYGEIVVFDNGVKGMVQDIRENEIGVILFGRDTGIKEGTKVVRTKKKAGIPVGSAFVGRRLKVMCALLQQAVIHIHQQALQGMVTDLLKVWDTALHQYFRHLYLLM